MASEQDDGKLPVTHKSLKTRGNVYKAISPASFSASDNVYCPVQLLSHDLCRELSLTQP